MHQTDFSPPMHHHTDDPVHNTISGALKRIQPKSDESGTSSDESGTSRDESADDWDESAARAGRLIDAPDTDLVEFERACHDEDGGRAYSRVWRTYLDVTQDAEVTAVTQSSAPPTRMPG